MGKSIHVLMLILLLVLESALANILSSLSHADECSQLFEFKESMSINKSAFRDSRAYPKVASWNLNISDGVRNCCLWDGVECRFGHVIGLNLSSSFLYGPIYSNNSLFNLIHLRTLNLAYNNFRSSQIPSGIGRLLQLANLNLSYSRFSGDVPRQISQLRNLVSLDLTGNQLKLQSSDFQNLVQNSSETLRELFLSWVKIESELPASIGNLTHLKIMKLSGCGFTGTLPASVSNLTQLTYLDLSDNEFSGPIQPSIGNLTHLNILDLSSCAFTGTLPASVSNLTQLTYLDLSNNKFTGSLPSLESFSNLTYLSLSGNNFERWKLPDWFGKLKKITHLYLIDVNLYGEIPSSFFNLTHIEELYLSRNQLKGQLSSSLLSFQNLESFVFSYNNATVDFYLFLSLTKLRNLYLSGNDVKLSVTDSHTNETQPKFIGLGLSSCNLKVFPEFLQFQNQLEYLYLEENKIEGLIPRWMWNISKETLRFIYLSQNLLTGFEQHSPIAPWVSLKELDLSYNMLHGSIPVPPPTTIWYSLSNNNLTGEIPPSICDLLSLQLLDLSFNNISGLIPPCLEKLSNSNLKVLNLSSNTLQGTIPNIFTTESRLQSIDLSLNKLDGKVPRSLENCESLKILNLGNNFIEDIFPFWLGALSKLQVLILRFNKFHGIIRIPAKFKVNFPKLIVIDISHNLFSGDLPYQYFQEWSAMKEAKANATLKYIETEIEEDFKDFIMLFDYSFSLQIINKGVKMIYTKIITTLYVVDLSNNMFRGKIPESIQTLSGLKVLNLSNNELCGVIPSSIGNLMHLESLDLSNNKLYGMIPQDLVQLNSLAFFNVSNNNLSGRIPQGKQFYTFSNDSYIGNQALCGLPLSMKCGDSKALEPPKVSLEEDTESDFPNGIDWVVILIGVVTGLLIGLVYGDHLTTRYYKWLLQKFGKGRS